MGLQYTKIQCNAFDIVRMRHAQLFYCRPYTFKTISSLTRKSQLYDWFSKQLFRFPSCSNCLLLQLTSPLYESAAHPMGRGVVALCLRVVRPSVRTCVHNRAVAFSDRLAVDFSLISHNHKVTVWACYKAPFPMAVRDFIVISPAAKLYRCFFSYSCVIYSRPLPSRRNPSAIATFRVLTF